MNERQKKLLGYDSLRSAQSRGLRGIEHENIYDNVKNVPIAAIESVRLGNDSAESPGTCRASCTTTGFQKIRC